MKEEKEGIAGKILGGEAFEELFGVVVVVVVVSAANWDVAELGVVGLSYSSIYTTSSVGLPSKS